MTCPICNGEHGPNEECGTLVRRAAAAVQGGAGGAAPAAAGPQSAPPVPSDGEEADPLIGQTLGSFRVVKRLGKGGMGSVYLGEQTVIGSKVAIKVLHEHLASNPSLVSRFYAEARAVNLIGHDNIVNIFDMNVSPQGWYFLVMEYLEGRPLQSLTKGPVDASVAIPILTQVCDALHAAHTHGVIHRDLKPENIFLARRGRQDNFVKVLDFGIAKLFATEYGSEQTSAGVIIGTPEYMAPEQAQGQRPDGRADIYSVGIIGYLLATGRLPFAGGGLTGLLMAHREKIPVAPADVNPKVPRAWSDVIMRAIAKKPADRYKDAAELRDAMDAALNEATQAVAAAVNAAVPAPVIVPPKPGPKLQSTPEPLDSRHAATFDANWMQGDGKVTPLKCVDISRGGMFLCYDATPPPVFSKINLVLNLPGVAHPFAAEVVRHVTMDQAKAWGMSQGFGVQFVDQDPRFKEAIARIVQGLPPAKPTAIDTPTPDDNLETEPQLEHYRKRIGGDHYVVLALPSDADFSDVRQRAREAQRELEELKAKRLSPRQLAQVNTAIGKVQQSMECLAHAPKRLAYDAHRGNFRGVARCISAGITVTELERLRVEYLITHQNSEAAARIHFTTGTSWESRGQIPMALDEYEQALTGDPLNLTFQQRYWALKRRVQAATPRS
jgi:serine/threonine protein kinase